MGLTAFGALFRPAPEHKTERPYEQRTESYAERCLPTPQVQQARLEVLRYKWGGYRNGLRVVQWLGDWWRCL